MYEEGDGFDIYKRERHACMDWIPRFEMRRRDLIISEMRGIKLKKQQQKNEMCTICFLNFWNRYYFGKSCEINNARGGGKRIWRGHVCGLDPPIVEMRRRDLIISEMRGIKLKKQQQKNEMCTICFLNFWNRYYFGKSCEINNARGGGKRIWRGHVCVDWIPPDSRNEEESFDNIRDEGDIKLKKQQQQK